MPLCGGPERFIAVRTRKCPKMGLIRHQKSDLQPHRTLSWLALLGHRHCKLFDVKQGDSLPICMWKKYVVMLGACMPPALLQKTSRKLAVKQNYANLMPTATRFLDIG